MSIDNTIKFGEIYKTSCKIVTYFPSQRNFLTLPSETYIIPIKLTKQQTVFETQTGSGFIATFFVPELSDSFLMRPEFFLSRADKLE